MKDDIIRVLIVYDETMVRYALTLALARNHSFQVDHCHSSAEMLSHVTSRPSHVILLGYDPADEQSLQAILSVTRDAPLQAKVMVLASRLNELTAWLLARSGVRGILLKAITLEALAEGICTVHDGGTCFTPCFADAIRRCQDSPGLRLLTPREHETLSAIVNGLTNKEIAQHLGITESGVKSVVQRLFRKMGAESRSQLLRIALEKYAG